MTSKKNRLPNEKRIIFDFCATGTKVLNTERNTIRKTKPNEDNVTEDIDAPWSIPVVNT